MAVTPADERLDVVALIPFQPYTGHAVEPMFRRTMGSHIYSRIGCAYSELASFLGRDLLFVGGNSPRFGPHRAAVEFASHRSLTAIALATHFERAGLRWRVLDPGQQEIRYWRHRLEELAPLRPHAVGVSTTFALGGRWLRMLCAVFRAVLPSTKIVLGGYYYASDAADFLSIDADVYCVGAGEGRFEEIVARLRDGGN